MLGMLKCISKQQTCLHALGCMMYLTRIFSMIQALYQALRNNVSLGKVSEIQSTKETADLYHSTFTMFVTADGGLWVHC